MKRALDNQAITFTIFFLLDVDLWQLIMIGINFQVVGCAVIDDKHQIQVWKMLQMCRQAFIAIFGFDVCVHPRRNGHTIGFFMFDRGQNSLFTGHLILRQIFDARLDHQNTHLTGQNIRDRNHHPAIRWCPRILRYPDR